jgi:2-C-methyl-D-erythritol 4-phosphate cytidylyltransferase
MNIALITAAGKGERTGQDIPKQFLHIENKPVIIYTLKAFQEHPNIDSILVVCLDGWRDILTAYAKQFNITKLKWVVSGADSVQESLRNGVYALEGICADEDNVIIHDGIRPLVDESVLSDIIVKCDMYGNGVSSLPYNEQIFVKEDDISTKKYIPRETLRRVQTPQCYKFKKLLWAYKEAFEKSIGIYGSAYTNTMMVDLGETLYFAAGSEKNLKITTIEDIEIFKALLKTEQDDYIKVRKA